VELRAQFGLTRYFSGQIVRVAARGGRGRHWYYEATLAPKLWHASRRSDFRIWQDVTVRDIADQVLQANAVNYEWRLKNSYKTWEYLVQYGETDLDFLSRLFENEGIYYWFEHGPEGEKMILGDHFSIHEVFGGYGQIPFYPPDAAMADVDHFQQWCAERRPEPGRFTHADYDFRHPSKDLRTEHSDPRGHLFDQYEIHAYPGNYAEMGDGKGYAAARLEALQRNQDTIELEGNVRGAVPGCRFLLFNHPRRDQNREFLITSAQYEASNGDYEAGPDAEQGHYRVQVGAIPADRQFRSELRTPKPRTHGTETAVVVGPPGSEIHTDQYGRVKVHFHWDRYGARDGSDSCWIRVSTPWAGKGFGSVSIPRVGHEVVVDYEHGDPDRPLVVGQVYNTEMMPPWALPAGQNQSGLLSRSTPGGSEGNALRFDDSAGAEQFMMHAQHNMDTTVNNSETHSVGVDRTTDIGANETCSVGGTRSTTVTGDETLTCEADRTKTIAGNETSDISGNCTRTIAGNESTDITGNRNETVVGDESCSITGNRTKTVCGSEGVDISQDAEITSGPLKHMVGALRQEKVAEDHLIDVSGDMTTTAANYIVNAGDQAAVDSDTTIYEAPVIIIKAGISTITLTTSGITFCGPMNDTEVQETNENTGMRNTVSAMSDHTGALHNIL